MDRNKITLDDIPTAKPLTRLPVKEVKVEEISLTKLITPYIKKSIAKEFTVSDYLGLGVDAIRMFLFKKAGYINEPAKSIFTIILEIILEYLKIRNNKNE
jgi:hypothetical protein